MSSLTKDQLERAMRALKLGEVIAFPTETYFGLGVDIFNEEAIKKLFSLKERSSDKPILVLVDNIGKLNSVVSFIPSLYKPLISTFWPGPLTLIFPASDTISSLITGKSGTIGIRISPSKIANALCEKWGKPISATSANISEQLPASTGEQVRNYFGQKIKVILPDQKEMYGNGSTIIRQTGKQLQILREGPISREDIILCLSEAGFDNNIFKI